MSENVEMISCDNCSSEINIDNSVGVDTSGRLFCADCISLCERCDREFVEDEMTSLEGVGYVCDGCLGYYARCDGCYHGSEYHLIRDMHPFPSGGHICECCYDSDYFYCDYCGNLHHLDDGRDGVCDYCREGDPDSDFEGHIHCSSYTPTFRYYGAGMRLGTEVEVDSDDKGTDRYELSEALYPLSQDEALFYQKEDGSLSRGIEIVSMPCSLEYHRKFFPWKSVFETVRKHGFKSHDIDSCGLHVHVSRRHIRYVEAIKLGIFVNTNIKAMEYLARRTHNDMARFKMVRKGELKDVAKSTSRYEAINFTNLHTIEFRLFRGTLKYSSFMASLELVHAMVHFVKTVNVIDIVPKDIEVGGMTVFKNGNKGHGAWEHFCRYVLKNKKNYHFLVSYMKERGVLCV